MARSRAKRGLRKTRRRWRLATLAVLPFIGAYVSHAYPIVRDQGWWRIAPDIVLITMLPRIDPNTHLLYNEVLHRAATDPSSMHHAWWSTGSLWPWERWLLRRQSLALIDSTSRPEIEELAARILAISSDDPVPLVGQERKATVILAWSKLRYQNCETYTDIGVTTNHDPQYLELGLPQDPNPRFFLTAFERGDRIHQQETQFVSSMREWSHRASWRGPDGRVFKWWNYGGVEEDTDYFGSSPTSHVWDALDPTESWSSILDYFFGAEELVGIETIRGRRCYHVIESGESPRDRLEVWIDQETGLVRQHYFSQLMFHYEPALDAEVDASWYTFDPEHSDRSPLMQRLDQINAILPGRNLLEPRSSDEGG